MAFTHGHVPPHKGKSTACCPIKSVEHIAGIKELLADRPRDLALFVVGVNSALRGGDLLALERSDLEEVGDGRIALRVLERKTGKPRAVLLNLSASAALRRHLEASSGRYVFEGQRGRLTVSYLARLVKGWCEEVGVSGRIASHSLRKTWVRIQHDVHQTSMATLMTALGHSSELQTLVYMGRMADDVAKAYEHEV